MFRTHDGRPVARLSYGPAGGVFELLNDRGSASVRLGDASPARATPAPAIGARGYDAPRATGDLRESLDEITDPWKSPALGYPRPRPASGL
jgi:hypothetical protein